MPSRVLQQLVEAVAGHARSTRRASVRAAAGLQQQQLLHHRRGVLTWGCGRAEVHRSMQGPHLHAGLTGVVAAAQLATQALWQLLQEQLQVVAAVN